MNVLKNTKLAGGLAFAWLTLNALNPALAHEGEPHQPAASNVATLSADARAVTQVLQGYAQAITANDLTRVRPLLVPDDGFSFFEGSFVNVGWQSYYDHMTPEMKLFEKPDYRITGMNPFVSGDLAYATFDWAMDVTVVSDKFEGGRHPVAMRGKGTAVLSRLDGQWKIRHLHTAQAPARKPAATSH